MAYQKHTREDDERILHWLRLSDAGFSFAEIATKFGTGTSTVSMAIKRVRDAIKAERAA